ncbi:MAG: glycogen/starch synthase [Bacteroidales bacterium]|nr:glycogen/starch synthase [Bacteroidales bacterium]
MKLKVLYVAQEISPYVPDSEMSLACRKLPQGIQEKGQEIRIFMPKFGVINERRNQLHEVIRLSGMNLIINDTDHALIIKVASIQPARIQVYFIDNEDLFPRKYMVNDDGQNNFNADEKALFFSKGVVETVKKLGWAPNIIHCNGWFTAIFPFMMKKVFFDEPLFVSKYKIVYTIYNDKFSGSIDPNFYNKLCKNNVSESDVEQIKEPTWEALTKFAIDYADAIVIGSKDVDENIIKYAEDSKKPLLKFSDEESFIDDCNNFYLQISEE